MPRIPDKQERDASFVPGARRGEAALELHPAAEGAEARVIQAGGNHGASDDGVCRDA